jgi:acyl carrier protein
MSREDFLEELADVLEVEQDELTDDFELNEDNWTSLALISTIALIDEYFDTIVSGEKLSNCSSIKALLSVIEAA